MRRWFTVVALSGTLTLGFAGTALAHPGDATDTGFANSFAQTGEAGVFDIPGPNGQGVFNTKFTLAELTGDHPVSNSVLRNPVCGTHRNLEA